MSEPDDDRVALAAVLTEVGELTKAEALVADVLEENADALEALSLLAKIKHIRGELSQAIACWAQLHARSPLSHTAIVQLRALLNLATDPERGAGEYVALGLELVRKPAAQLEIERAFGLFLARRPDEARALASQLAAKYRGRDASLYKLAVLAEAWIAELSGEVESACSTLEALGRERGFETDTDRVLMLARMYERLGTPERLEAALHICKFLAARDRDPALLGRIATLYRRLDEDEQARSFEAAFLDEFRRWMHRPSWPLVRRVAGRFYVPLTRLVALDIPRDPPEDPATTRERGIELAVRRDLGAAADCFDGSEELLDRKYAADVRLLVGDVEGAKSRYERVLELDPRDLTAASFLLRAEREQGDARLADKLAQLAGRSPTREALEAELRRSPFEPALWHDLSLLEELAPDRRVEADDARLRAHALEEARSRSRHAVGRALAAAVYHFVGVTHGLVHEVWASREPAAPGQGGSLPTSQVLGSLSPEMRQGIQSTFVSVREYARAKFPHLTRDILDFTYSFKITKEDEPSYGSSAGLPCALVFLSVFLQVPIPQDIASSGALVTDAHDVLVVGPVGDTVHKVRGAVNRNLRFIVLPEANRSELYGTTEVPREVLDQTVRHVRDLDEAVRIVFGEHVFLRSRPWHEPPALEADAERALI